ncbi:hypothetical protein K474DRAFT_1665146 [Panus rudis PR-1116 ss-1]|nr:hypothetical protein K474DRAFT_1665146 [Panus rudis PR-1116 ss-1]
MSHAIQSPRLPQELIDNIIFHVADDRPTLESFLFVSRACLDTARAHIFAKRTIKLQHTYGFHEFVEDLKDHSQFAKYITELHVTSALKWFDGDYKELTSFGPSGDFEEDDDSGEPPVLSTHIIPDSLFDLLPRLEALSVSKVWVVLPSEAKRASVKTADGYHDDNDPESTKKVHLKSLSFRSIIIWKPVDHTLAQVLDRFTPTEFSIEGVNTGRWRSPYPSHVNTIRPPAPIVYPVYLSLDATVTRPSYMEALQLLTSTKRLRNLRFTDVGEANEVAGLGTYLTPAHDTLTDMYIHIWGIKYEGKDPWPPLNLPSFTALRNLKIVIPIIGSSTTKMGYIWKAFADFLRYLPTGNIKTLELTLKPDNTFLGSKKGLLGRMPDSIKAELDGLFKRLLPTLERFELIWIYEVGAEDLEGVDEPYDPERYINDIRGLIPCVDETGVLRVRRVDVPAPEYPFYNDSDFSEGADRDLWWEEEKLREAEEAAREREEAGTNDADHAD